MAHIVCITSGLRGLLNASFELVERLQQSGHTITYACPWDVREAVEAQGLHYVQLRPVTFSPAPPPERLSGSFSSLRSRLDEWRSAGQRRAAGVDALDLDPFREFIRDTAPDLVLIDSELYEHVFTVYQMRVPMLLITPFFPTWQRPGLPPLQVDLIPGNGWRGSRPGIALTWWYRRFGRWRHAKMIGLRSAFTERRSVLKQYARQVGFPLRHLDEYGSRTLFNERHLPVLSLTARELDFDHDLRPGVHYAGPMVALRRREDSVTDVDRTRLDELYARRASDGRPLMYCSVTTMHQRDGDFLKRVIAAFASQMNWHLIVGLGGKALIDGVEQPANVHGFNYVPQIEVLRHCDLCITFGGMNTIHECISLTVPMLIYPRYNDQPGVAARLAHRGLAHRGDATRDKPSDIVRRVEGALDDAPMCDRLSAMQEVLAGYASNSVLEKIVERVLGQTGRP